MNLPVKLLPDSCYTKGKPRVWLVPVTRRAYIEFVQYKFISYRAMWAIEDDVTGAANKFDILNVLEHSSAFAQASDQMKRLAAGCMFDWVSHVRPNDFVVCFLGVGHVSVGEVLGPCKANLNAETVVFKYAMPARWSNISLPVGTFNAGEQRVMANLREHVRKLDNLLGTRLLVATLLKAEHWTDPSLRGIAARFSDDYLRDLNPQRFAEMLQCESLEEGVEQDSAKSADSLASSETSGSSTSSAQEILEPQDSASKVKKTKKAKKPALEPQAPAQEVKGGEPALETSLDAVLEPASVPASDGVLDAPEVNAQDALEAVSDSVVEPRDKPRDYPTLGSSPTLDSSLEVKAASQVESEIPHQEHSLVQAQAKTKTISQSAADKAQALEQGANLPQALESQALYSQTLDQNPAQAASYSQTDSLAQAKAQAQTQTKAQTKAQTKTQAKAKANTKDKAQAKTQGKAKSKIQVQTQAQEKAPSLNESEGNKSDGLEAESNIAAESKVAVDVAADAKTRATDEAQVLDGALLADKDQAANEAQTNEDGTQVSQVNEIEAHSELKTEVGGTKFFPQFPLEVDPLVQEASKRAQAFMTNQKLAVLKERIKVPVLHQTLELALQSFEARDAALGAWAYKRCLDYKKAQAEAAQAEAAQSDAAKSETDKAETAKTETDKVETSKAETALAQDAQADASAASTNEASVKAQD